MLRPSPALDTLPELLEAVLQLRASIAVEGADVAQSLGQPIERASFASSARNLADYLALREHDLRAMQVALMPWGLSSLGRLESRVMPTLDAVAHSLAELAGQGARLTFPRPSMDDFFRGETLLDANADEVFGPAPHGRRERIMATLPTEAATDASLVHELIRSGADILRINCAHDDPDVWSAMVHQARTAAAELGHEIRIDMDLEGQKPRIHEFIAPPERRLTKGDLLFLTEAELGSPAPADFQARCAPATVLAQLGTADEISIDDGKVATFVEAAGEGWALLRVTRAPRKGKVLRSGLGLNFPGRHIDLPALTKSDLDHLDFVAANADIVGYSFVQCREDVILLQEELRRRGRTPALMVKIETEQAVRKLPEIIVQGARHQPLAVMIARGDLAVNIGYLRLAEIQEELMWLSEAANVPVVWATQVLERLVQKGVPSRAEVTDAAMAERAECVMLNKGPHMLEAVALLDKLLHRMEKHQWKKVPMLRALHAWDRT